MLVWCWLRLTCNQNVANNHGLRWVRRGTCGDMHPWTPQLQLGSVCSHLRIKKGVTYLDSNRRGMLKRGGPHYELASYWEVQLLSSLKFSFTNNNSHLNGCRRQPPTLPAFSLWLPDRPHFEGFFWTDQILSLFDGLACFCYLFLWRTQNNNNWAELTLGRSSGGL